MVGSAGQVAQMVPERDIAWHAGNWPYNETSIGIEHAGFTNKTVFPDPSTARRRAWPATSPTSI